MPKNHEVLVVAGAAGSKSTFIGGLYQHVHRDDDLGIHFTPVEGNYREDFREGLLNRMLTQNKYPAQTEDGYIVELTIDGGGTAIPETNFKFIDIPGEQINEVLPKMQNDIEDEGIDEEQVSNDYDDIKSDIGGDQQLTIDDYVTIFENFYTNATMVLFLLNIHKLIVRDEMLSVPADLVETTAERKTKTAVVPTAVDLIGYDADDPDFDSTMFFDARKFDEGLRRQIEDRIDLSTSPTLVSMVEQVKSDESINMFSVSVPPLKPGETDNEELKPDGDYFETSGFDQVISWLKD